MSQNYLNGILEPNQNHLSWSIILAGHFLFPSFSIYLCLFVSQAAGSPLRFTVKPLMNSPLKFKQQHHLWIANCALMGEPVQTLCDQSSHHHQFTAKQVEVYYLKLIFWNLKNAKKEAFIHQITLADPRLQHLHMTIARPRRILSIRKASASPSLCYTNTHKS